MNIAIIPARGKSERIRNKNIINFFGKPIIYWPIQNAKKTNLFKKIIVSTDNKKIAKISKLYGAEVPFVRPSNISNNKTGILKVIKHCIRFLEKKKIKFKYVCCIFSTAPLLNKKILQSAYKKLLKGKYDFVFGAIKIQNHLLRSFYLNNKKIEMINSKFYSVNSQDLPNAFVDSGQFYWGTKKAWKSKNKIFGNNSSFLELNEKKFTDINEIKDLRKLKRIAKNYIKRGFRKP
tara:strand:- start:8115 stop:8816 length:702 start_codon:yes stop_codon:yes gene_type:complete